MTLSFSTKWKDNKPTYFVEKILNGLIEFLPQLTTQIDSYEYNYNLRFNWTLKELENNQSKIHTIRKDSKDRWKVGNKIHFVINNRTKNRFQFAPILTVKSIQKFEMKVERDGHWRSYRIFIDDKLMYSSHEYEEDLCKWSLYDFELFALNDGFDNIRDFLDWFSEDFEGKIIHWTDTLY